MRHGGGAEGRTDLPFRRVDDGSGEGVAQGGRTEQVGGGGEGRHLPDCQRPVPDTDFVDDAVHGKELRARAPPHAQGVGHRRDPRSVDGALGRDGAIEIDRHRPALPHHGNVVPLTGHDRPGRGQQKRGHEQPVVRELGERPATTVAKTHALTFLDQHLLAGRRVPARPQGQSEVRRPEIEDRVVHGTDGELIRVAGERKRVAEGAQHRRAEPALEPQVERGGGVLAVEVKGPVREQVGRRDRRPPGPERADDQTRRTAPGARRRRHAHRPRGGARGDADRQRARGRLEYRGLDAVDPDDVVGGRARVELAAGDGHDHACQRLGGGEARDHGSASDHRHGHGDGPVRRPDREGAGAERGSRIHGDLQDQGVHVRLLARDVDPARGRHLRAGEVEAREGDRGRVATRQGRGRDARDHRGLRNARLLRDAEDVADRVVVVGRCLPVLPDHPDQAVQVVVQVEDSRLRALGEHAVREREEHEEAKRRDEAR